MEVVIRLVMLAAVLVAVAGAIIHVRFFRGLPQSTYDPRAAWLRAAVFISVCWVVSAWSGTLDVILDSPVATAAQVEDISWWVWTAAAAAVILICYPVVWARWTLTFDRPRRPFAQILFGLAWGTGTGQLLASVYVVTERTGWSRWTVWLAGFAAIAAWQGLWHDLVWDVWVTPEHDTPTTIRNKVLGSHIPNVAVTLTYLVVNGNVAVFVGLQTIALVSASVAMRFPVFYETRPVRAATTGPAPFGLLRCTGYVTDDPHPYRTQREAAQ